MSLTALRRLTRRRENLLNNEGYVNKAPANLVSSEKEKLEIEKQKLEELLKKCK